MNTLPDVYPAISIGLEHGQGIESIEINIAGITEYLRQGGVSDEEIGKTSITLSDTRQPDRDGETTKGNNNRESHVINLFYGEEVACAASAGIPIVDEIFSAKMTSTLVHELKHSELIHDEELQADVKKLYRSANRKNLAKVMGTYVTTLTAGSVLIENIANTSMATGFNFAVIPAGALGLLVLKRTRTTTPQQLYDRNPEEALCRQAASEYRGPRLITIKSNSSKPDLWHTHDIGTLSE